MICARPVLRLDMALASFVFVLFLLAAPAWAAGAEAPGRDPAVLFLSGPMSAFGGGTYLRRNMARLDQLGYRVAYHSYPEVFHKPAGFIQSFDVVVLLDLPDVTAAGASNFYSETRKLLAAGGGLMVFTYTNGGPMKSFISLMDHYGIYMLLGCMSDADPARAMYGEVSCAYTTRIAANPLCEGVHGFWYPVGVKRGTVPYYDTLRGPNTAPFDVDGNWTVLASVSATTALAPYDAAAASENAPLLQQERLTRPRTEPLPLVAVAEHVEGKGRLAFCAINSVYTGFVCGDTSYDGLCTGKGIQGKPSDLDKLLMNVLAWLGKNSQAAGRATISQSDRPSFAESPWHWPPPIPAAQLEALLPNPDQFRGVVGVRSCYSGGKSIVAEYAKTARELGIQYLAFLEDFASLDPKQFEQFKAECEANSDASLVLLPGLRIQSNLDIWYFAFRKGLNLPVEGCLAPGTRKIIHTTYPHYPFVAGEVQWTTDNGLVMGLACGNFRLEEKTPFGVPPEDYNLDNPFISLYTYRDGQPVDSMVDTYLKCAGRTEWPAPIAIHLIDSADQLRKDWNSDEFQTVYLRSAGAGLKGFYKDVGEMYGHEPAAYVTNGPRIDEWRDNRGFDAGGSWWDWTRYEWRVKMSVSSDAGLKEIVVMNGQHPFRRFLPGGVKHFEQTLVLAHDDMHDLILFVTDCNGRQAISAEQWDLNHLLQLTWCGDRNNMLCYAALPSPDSATGCTAGNYPTPFNMEKSAFRESLLVPVNMDRTLLPGFDGQPYPVAGASPWPIVTAAEGTESGSRVARDIGRDLCSPDVAIHTAACRLMYDPAIPSSALSPWTKGPLVPLQLFNADLRYITFTHAGRLAAPVILEGRIKFLKALTPAKNRPLTVNVLYMTSSADRGYEKAAVMHTGSADQTFPIVYKGPSGGKAHGAFKRGAYVYLYPSLWHLGSVGVMSLDDHLVFNYYDGTVSVGYDMGDRSVKAGDEIQYRLMVFASGYNEPADTRLPEALRNQLGVNDAGSVGYAVNVEQGMILGKEYLLRVDGQGKGFTGEIILPEGFPVTLPVVVENLNDHWTSVMYDREKRLLRPLGMHDNKAYCHRTPEERAGRIFIGHPFTLDRPELWLTVVQTGPETLTLQIHNPTDRAASVRVRRSPYFDFVSCGDFTAEAPAGRTVEYAAKADGVHLSGTSGGL